MTVGVWAASEMIVSWVGLSGTGVVWEDMLRECEGSRWDENRMENLLALVLHLCSALALLSRAEGVLARLDRLDSKVITGISCVYHKYLDVTARPRLVRDSVARTPKNDCSSRR